MRGPFSILKPLILVSCWIALPFSVLAAEHTELLDRPCSAGVPPQAAIEALADEAEAAGMPVNTLSRLLKVGYREEGGVEYLRDILCVIVRAEEDGLPPGLLFETLAEGLGKRVPLARILAVIEKKKSDLDYAWSLQLEGGRDQIDNPDVERIAIVLSLGIPRPAIAKLFDPALPAPNQMRVIAAEILGYGRAMDFEPELLEKVVWTGLTREAFTKDWTYFIKVISEARRKDIPDARIAETAINVLSENGTLEELIGELGVRIHPPPVPGG
jgi:hypothetical protein